jgi:chromosome segregation ATPase
LNENEKLTDLIEILQTSWKKQHDALKEFYETQLQKQSHENLSRQNELTQTIEQLRQHNLKLHQQFQSAIECKSAMQTSVEELERKCVEAEARLEEAQWTINEKTDQICLLKKNRSLTGDRDGDSLCQQVVQLQNKLETAQKEALQRNAELKDLRQTLNFLSQELFQVQKKFDSTKEELDQRRENAANRSKRASLLIGTSELSLFNDSGETERLRKDLMELRSKYGGEKRAMEEERAAWFEEKEKVIKYQKQLQLNYLEIYKRNCSLETELDDINASLRINDVDQDRPDSVRESDC